MYKDTITEITPLLEKAFPGVAFKFYQAGSEDVAAKVNGELMAKALQADVIISSDRFWYEELADKELLHAYSPKGSEKISPEFNHPKNFYTTVAIPVMVLAYNSEVIKAEDAPKSFREMTDPKWKGKFTIGSPLASGTNFTTIAMLLNNYGWEFIDGLRKNDTISDGGNSAVIQKMQSKERPIGWVLLENLLRFQDTDKRLQAIFPEDGVIIHNNVMAISKKEGNRELAEHFADWMFGPEGQAAIVRSYMYSPLPASEPPRGAPKFSDLKIKNFAWSRDFISHTVKNRTEIKEKFASIMFEK
jgi:iron(III) transport system substrate-binding protein